MNDQKFYSIGEIAEQTGLSRRALRLYEQAGLLQPQRDSNNYRLYVEEDKQRAMLIHHLRQSGLGIKSIRQLFLAKQTNLSPSERLTQATTILKDARQQLVKQRAQIKQALAYIDSELEAIQDYQTELSQVEKE